MLHVSSRAEGAQRETCIQQAAQLCVVCQQEPESAGVSRGVCSRYCEERAITLAQGLLVGADAGDALLEWPVPSLLAAARAALRTLMDLPRTDAVGTAIGELAAAIRCAEVSHG